MSIIKRSTNTPFHRTHIRGLLFSREKKDLFLHSWSIDGVCSRHNVHEDLSSFFKIDHKILHILPLDDGRHGVIDTSMHLRLFSKKEEVHQMKIPALDAGILCAHYHSPNQQLLLGLASNHLLKLQENRDPVIISTPFEIHRIYGDDYKYVALDEKGNIRIGDVGTLEEWRHIPRYCDAWCCETLIVNDSFFIVDGDDHGIIAVGPLVSKIGIR